VKFFFDDEVIILTLSVNRTQCISVLFSPLVISHNSKVTNSIGKRRMNKLNKLVFHFLTYRSRSFRHLSHLSTSFWMPDAKKDAGCCPSRWL